MSHSKKLVAYHKHSYGNNIIINCLPPLTLLGQFILDPGHFALTKSSLWLLTPFCPLAIWLSGLCLSLPNVQASYPYYHLIFISARSASWPRKSGHQIYTAFPTQKPRNESVELFVFSAKGLAFVVLAICIAVALSVVFVVVLTAGFSYYRKLWSPEVGLCFQVCTGTLALDGERLLSQHESGLRFSSTHSGLHFRVVLGQLGFLIGDWN